MNVDAKANAIRCLVQDLPGRAYTSALLLTASASQRARICHCPGRFADERAYSTFYVIHCWVEETHRDVEAQSAVSRTVETRRIATDMHEAAARRLDQLTTEPELAHAVATPRSVVTPMSARSSAAISR